mmetsp:Transcript_18034/g.27598  ORF Transcript_18034/g.27598 Transcript_18034/m.27598 type:complete len:227 (+) Transcript_18034:2839-3519(+)
MPRTAPKPRARICQPHRHRTNPTRPASSGTHRAAPDYGPGRDASRHRSVTGSRPNCRQRRSRHQSPGCDESARYHQQGAMSYCWSPTHGAATDHTRVGQTGSHGSIQDRNIAAWQGCNRHPGRHGARQQAPRLDCRIVPYKRDAPARRPASADRRGRWADTDIVPRAFDHCVCPLLTYIGLKTQMSTRRAKCKRIKRPLTPLRSLNLRRWRRNGGILTENSSPCTC